MSTIFPVSVAAADLSGDGDQDIVCANENSSLTVFFQESPASFAPTPLTLTGPGVSFPASVATADMDEDGDLEIVSANSKVLTVFFQDSFGSFSQTPLIVGEFQTANFLVSVATADMDGDGDQDLVSANRGTLNLTVYFQSSPGSFTSPALTLGGMVSPFSVSVADLDGDGDQDVVSANPFGNSLTAFFQRSLGDFDPEPLSLVVPGPVGSGPFFVTTTDLDLDDDQDIISANRDSDNLTLFFQNCAQIQSFASIPLTLGDALITLGPVSVATSDFDGDGDQDLLSANTDGNNFAVFWGGR
jgi:hypothetical protein